MLDTLRSVIAALEAQKITAALDGRDLNPPCVWLAPRRLGMSTVGGCESTVFDAAIIVPDTGIDAALETLDELLETVRLALTGAGVAVTHANFDESVTLPSGGGPLPAFVIECES